MLIAIIITHEKGSLTMKASQSNFIACSPISQFLICNILQLGINCVFVCLCILVFVCLYVCMLGEGVGRTIESNRRHVSPPSVTHLLLGIKARTGVIDDQIGQNG